MPASIPKPSHVSLCFSLLLWPNLVPTASPDANSFLHRTTEHCGLGATAPCTCQDGKNPQGSRPSHNENCMSLKSLLPTLLMTKALSPLHLESALPEMWPLADYPPGHPTFPDWPDSKGETQVGVSWGLSKIFNIWEYKNTEPVPLSFSSLGNTASKLTKKMRLSLWEGGHGLVQQTTTIQNYKSNPRECYQYWSSTLEPRWRTEF